MSENAVDDVSHSEGSSHLEKGSVDEEVKVVV